MSWALRQASRITHQLAQRRRAAIACLRQARNSTGCGERREPHRLALLPCTKFWDILATPNLRIDPSPPERMEEGMRPIGYASPPSMSYRVPMDVVHGMVEVSLIADEIPPETSLP